MSPHNGTPSALAAIKLSAYAFGVRRVAMAQAIPITAPNTMLEARWPRLNTKGTLATAPATIPTTPVRIIALVAAALNIVRCWLSHSLLPDHAGGYSIRLYQIRSDYRNEGLDDRNIPASRES